MGLWLGSGVGPGGSELLLCVFVQCRRGGMLFFWPDPAFTITAAKCGTEAVMWGERAAAAGCSKMVVCGERCGFTAGGLCSAPSGGREKALGEPKRGWFDQLGHKALQGLSANGGRAKVCRPWGVGRWGLVAPLSQQLGTSQSLPSSPLQNRGHGGKRLSYSLCRGNGGAERLSVPLGMWKGSVRESGESPKNRDGGVWRWQSHEEGSGQLLLISF